MSTTTQPTTGGLQSLIRPAWTPATIALTVLGFMTFWPLGLAMIAYIVWGERLDAFKDEANRATDGMMSQFRRAGSSFGAPAAFGRSGNVAFDDWREEEFRRLDEKRAELARMEAEFADYQRELRRAKDRKEFERFLRDRDGKVVDAQ